MTDMRTNPADFANQLAQLQAEADAILRKAGEGNLCHTTQSDGYPCKYTPLTIHDDLIELDYAEGVDDDGANNCESGLPTMNDLGLTWTPHLRRHRPIDEMDPMEALDATTEYIGVHVVAL